MEDFLEEEIIKYFESDVPVPFEEVGSVSEEVSKKYDVKMSLKIEFKKHSNRVSKLLFYPPNILVSLSWDGKIILYDTCLMKVMNIHQAFKGFGYCLAKFSSNSFFVGSWSSSIHGYSFNEKFEIAKIFDRNLIAWVYGLLKLDEKNLLCITNEAFQVIDVETNGVTKELKTQPIHDFSSWLFLSKNYANSFYISTDSRNPVKLINWKTEKVICFGKYNPVKDYLLCINIFHRSNNQEILVACCNDKYLYLYDTTSERERCVAISKIKTSEMISSIFFSSNMNNDLLKRGNQYIFAGGNEGKFEIFKGREFCYEKIFETDSLSRSSCSDIVLLGIHNEDVTVSAAFGKLVKIITFESENFDFYKKDIDEPERIEYLMQNLFNNFQIKIHLLKVFQTNRIFLCI